jgi:hypothetical protein
MASLKQRVARAGRYMSGLRAEPRNDPESDWGRDEGCRCRTDGRATMEAHHTMKIEAMSPRRYVGLLETLCWRRGTEDREIRESEGSCEVGRGTFGCRHLSRGIEHEGDDRRRAPAVSKDTND